MKWISEPKAEQVKKEIYYLYYSPHTIRIIQKVVGRTNYDTDYIEKGKIMGDTRTSKHKYPNKK